MKNNMKNLKNLLLESVNEKELTNAVEVLAKYFDNYQNDEKEVEKLVIGLLDKISNNGDNEPVFNTVEQWLKKRK